MGKGARKRQAAAMAEMNQLAQEQFDYYQSEQEKQQAVVDAQKEQYEAFQFQDPFADTRNPFAGIQTDFRNIYAGAENKFAGLENMYQGMENRFEDMTVDMRAADFQRQQMQQQQADIMQTLGGAAGTSGIAGLAQTLVSQGAMQRQQIAAGISQQERQNRMLTAQEGSRIDQLQRGAGMQLQQLEATGAMQTQQLQLSGEAAARQLGISQRNVQAQGQWQADMARMQGAAALQQAEFGRESTLLGMEYGLLGGANQALTQAMSNQMSGMGMQAQMYGSQAAAGASTFGNIITAAGTVKAHMLCIPKGVYIDSIDKKILIEDIKSGDVVIGYDGNPVKVLQKHEYLEDPTKERFYKVKFNNGSIVDVCDMHRIKGVRAKNIKENVVEKEVYSGVEFSYDLLTEDLGYRIDGIPVNSMIEELALAISEKLKNK